MCGFPCLTPLRVVGPFPQMDNLLENEYIAATRAVGVWEVAGAGAIHVTGRDATDYLHRMTTNSVTGMHGGEVRHTCLLKGDGRMVSPAYIAAAGDGSYWLFPPASGVEALAQQLEKYVIMEQVDLTDRSSNYFCLLALGPKAEELALQLVGAAPAPGQFELLTSLKGMVFRPASAPHQVDAWHFLLPVALEQELKGQAHMVLQKLGGSMLSAETFDAIRLEAGEPLFGQDYDVSSIPLEAGLGSSIDFAKGCFPGQEIVARIENLGHPAKILVRFQTPEEIKPGPRPGQELYMGDKPVGKVTSVAWSPASKAFVGLATVKWDHREAGTELTARFAEGEGVTVILRPTGEKS